MILFLPSPPPNYQQSAIVQVLDTIRRAFMNVVSTDEAVPRIMLRSPNGTAYEITVDNSGTLHATVNDGKSRI